MPNKKTGEYRNCLYCENELYVTQYKLKHGNGKYCNTGCQRKYEIQQTFSKIETDGVESVSNAMATQDRWLKRYLIDKYGNKCMICGWCEVNEHTGIIPVQLHHIDSNSNNRQGVTNVELRCPSCHALTENYGARGGGRD